MAISLDVDVLNPSGLHARPAATFVRAAAGFRSTIGIANLTTGAPEVPARSLIGVLGLGVRRGHRVRVRIEGEDEAEAATALRDLFADGLEAAGADGVPAGDAAPAGDGR